MTAEPTRGGPSRPGALAFVIRRATGIVLTLYLIVYLRALATEGSVGPFVGELGRRGELGFALLELLMIAVICAHAMLGLAQLLIERRGLARQHARIIGVFTLIAIALTLVHVPVLFGG